MVIRKNRPVGVMISIEDEDTLWWKIAFESHLEGYIWEKESTDFLKKFLNAKD